MRNFLEKVRTPNRTIKTKNKIINTSLIFLLGVLLGVFSKWLDNMGIDDTIWWQHILGVLDLRNIFSAFGIWLFIALTISVYSKTPLRAALNTFLFFVGMTVSYHLYTICFSGFNPANYMLIWYGMTLVSPILAYICWYAKGKNKISFLISCIILCVMFISSFSIGIWYFELKSIIDLLIFIGAVLVLYVNLKSTVCSVLSALIISFVINVIAIL